MIVAVEPFIFNGSSALWFWNVYRLLLCGKFKYPITLVASFQLNNKNIAEYGCQIYWNIWPKLFHALFPFTFTFWYFERGFFSTDEKIEKMKLWAKLDAESRTIHRSLHVAFWSGSIECVYKIILLLILDWLFKGTVFVLYMFKRLQR